MKRTFKYVVLAIVFVGFAFFYSHIHVLHAVYNEDVDNSEYLNTGILTDDNVCQKFVVSENRLDGLRIKCVTVGETDESTIEYVIIDCETEEVLRQGKVDGSLAENNKFVNLSFDTIEGCKDKVYEVDLHIVGKENAGLGFYVENSSEDAAYTVDGEKRDGTVIIRTETWRFDFETFFVVILFELYFVLFIKVMYKLFK